MALLQTLPLFEFGSFTDPGRKRGAAPNQDFLAVLPPEVEAGRPALLILADGMGGYRGGEIASRLVVETIAAAWREAPPGKDVGTLLEQCLQCAHCALGERAMADPDLRSMGSTAVLAALQDGQAWLANVGDSRAYLVGRREVRLLSHDHSVVADQVRAGRLTALQALRHPHRNRLTQSLTPRRTFITPYLTRVDLACDDVLLLCSDGLWGVVPESVLHAIAYVLPPQQAAEKLVALANQSGGPDNISVIIARRADFPALSDDFDALEDTRP